MQASRRNWGSRGECRLAYSISPMRFVCAVSGLAAGGQVPINPLIGNRLFGLRKRLGHWREIRSQAPVSLIASVEIASSAPFYFGTNEGSPAF
jgi:hypothetical protein